MFPSKKTYQMNLSDADATLQNVFAACNQAPNTIPIDRLLIRQASKTKTFDITLKITCWLLVLTLLSPLPFLFFIQQTANLPIILKESYITDNKLYLVLDSNNHIIKFEEAYLVSPGGSIYEIVSFDKETLTLCFPHIAPDCCIYIPYDTDSLLCLQPDTD